ncbi:glycosyltransferase family 2 protein [Enteractinococcus coprophilus]|nr:glycosyltransferase family A protein [Enteractinococcus coprophilus]
MAKQSDSTPRGVDSERSTEVTNPVDSYYRHKVKTNLPVFYRFALQTRSLAIRDTFAKAASSDGWDLADLLTVVENLDADHLTEPETSFLKDRFDSSVLLTLADLLANTARDDLDTHAAVQIYAFAYKLYGQNPFLKQHILQYVEALNEVGLYDRSVQLARAFDINDIAPLQTELLELQRTRKVNPSADAWLSALNAIYTSLDMSNVRLLSNASLPLMDRLTAGPTRPLDGPKVSVIMPTFAPGPGIRTALGSLLDQSWQNLEIIVVNDASPSRFNDLFKEVEELDPRIRVLHQEKNLGPYVARNAGLAVASGVFITTHDDDDWSHPDKIATQARVLLQQPAVVATTTAHIRATEDAVLRRLNIQAKFMQMNYSSLMFRRTVPSEVGDWDPVNRGGDSEFYTRLAEYYGSERIVGMHDKPLAFSRVWDGSLTSGEMSRGYFAYSRLLYRWAFRQWHWEMRKRGQKAIRKPDGPRPYAIPTTFEAGQRNKHLGLFDVVYITDFFRQAKYVDFVLKEIETLSAAGLRVGYMHLNSPETNRPAGLPQRLFELQYERKLTQLSLTDAAETNIVIVYDASIGMFIDQLSPTLKSHRGITVYNELPCLTGAVKRSPVQWNQTLRNLDSAFDTFFKVVGTTREDQEQLRSSVPSSRLLEDTDIWSLHLQGELISPTPPSQPPVVGFHSYGNRYRWPKSGTELRSVYRSRIFETRLYGQVEEVVEKYGEEVFDGIDLISMNQMSEPDFLSGIDYWVYWPNPRLRDKVWEPVLKAMQAGKVVLLPPHLEPIYGEGALYVDRDDISSKIAELTASTELYKAQAQRGQQLVQEVYTSELYLQRIMRLLGH